MQLDLYHTEMLVKHNYFNVITPNQDLFQRTVGSVMKLQFISILVVLNLFSYLVISFSQNCLKEPQAYLRYLQSGKLIFLKYECNSYEESIKFNCSMKNTGEGISVDVVMDVTKRIDSMKVHGAIILTKFSISIWKFFS